jgi:broad specificity phosphatase PhoE
VLLIRHASPVVSSNELPSEWPLSPSGRSEARSLGEYLRAALDLDGSELITSSERKAVETASHLGPREARVDPRASEVTRPWYDDAAVFRDAVRTYLTGGEVEGWEPIHAARGRFEAMVQESGSELLVVVSHGTVMSAWLAGRIPELVPSQFWEHLRMPDAWLVDFDDQTVTNTAPSNTLGVTEP